MTNNTLNTPTGTKIKLILVIGNTVQAEYIMSIFDKQQFDIINFNNGEVAYNYIKQEAPPDAVIIMSYQLNKMNGLEIMQKLKEQKYEPAILFLTADKTVERAIEAMQAGALDFLPKSDKMMSELLPKTLDVYKKQQKRLRHKKVEQELHDNREKLRAVITSLDDTIIIINKNNLYSDFYIQNPENSFFNPQKLIGKKYTTEFAGTEFQQNLSNAIIELKKQKKVQSFEFSFEKTTNQNAYFTGKVSLRKNQQNIFDGVTVVIRDITKRKLAEIELIENRNQLKYQNIEILQKNEEIQAQSEELERQKNYAEEQRDQIGKQNKKITDSILYAQRIQNATLPPASYIKHILPEHFIFYKPRDIVSGDFYWMTQKNNLTYIAAADCTGHGVPGAFMSMLGITMLNEIITHNDEINANEILNILRTEIIKSLKQTGQRGEATDGMDIAIVIINPQKEEMQFAAANSSAFFISQKKEHEIEIDELKGDNMPIGFFPKMDNQFNNQIIKITHGDFIYLFSDGYVDQFGGKNGRKLRKKNFLKIVEKIHDKPVSLQKELIEKSFNKWKGDERQVDDILVIGIKIILPEQQKIIKNQLFNWKDKTILIAEDQEYNYMLLEELLEESKVNIVWVKNGKEAIKIVKQQKIDAVLMDINMPDMDGYEATHEIKQINEKIPIIIQTAYTMHGEQEKSFKAGCDDYLAKPVQQKQLLQKLNAFFQKNSSK